MPSHLLRTGLALFASAAAISCSLAVSTDGLIGPADAGAPADVTISDRAVGDTAAPPGDATPNVDGGADASVTPSADAATDAFCTPGAIFCDDFERSDPKGTWDSQTLADGGVLEIATGTPTGGALHGLLPAGSDLAGASLKKALTPVITAQLTYETLLRVPSAPSAGIHMFELTFQSAAGSSVVIGYLIPSFGFVVGEVTCGGGANCTYEQSSPAAFLSGAWHALALTVDFRVAPASFRLVIDGATVILATSKTNVKPGTLSVVAGIASIDGAPHGVVDVATDQIRITGN